MDDTNKKLDEIIALLKDIKEKQKPIYVDRWIPYYPYPHYPYQPIIWNGTGGTTRWFNTTTSGN